MSRGLIIVGLIVVAVGVAWPWLSKFGLGRLPGDIRIERDGFQFFFPLTTGIVVSIALSVLIWLFRR
ncbi:MAG: DUF2905 domain-containing protein [Burkholderiales bacterium]|nr:DUF2905 domain-containing protein [Burkholderiales bacterium]